MAEGPVVHFYARRLNRLLAGKGVKVQFGVNKLKGRERDLDGWKLSRVEAFGKQFRIFFTTGHVVLVHLLMWGSWGIYTKDNEWDKPRKRARLIVRTQTASAVAFSAPIVRLYENLEALQASRWGKCGPDPLREDYALNEATRRLRGQGGLPIGVAIMDQRVVSGVGNILRNEVLFKSGIDPRREIMSLDDAELCEILSWTSRLMCRWLGNMGRRKDWIEVYRSSNRPCPRCGSKIEFFRQGGRVTYVCPDCQS